MKIRKVKFNEEAEIIECSGAGFEIVDDNGKAMFSISIDKNDKHILQLSGGDTNFINGKIYDGNFTIQPIAFNSVRLIKNKHGKQC